MVMDPLPLLKPFTFSERLKAILDWILLGYHGMEKLSDKFGWLGLSPTTCTVMYVATESLLAL